MQATGLEPIGTWSVIDSLNLTRMVEIQLATNPYNGVFHLLAYNLTKERVATVRKKGANACKKHCKNKSQLHTVFPHIVSSLE